MAEAPGDAPVFDAAAEPPATGDIPLESTLLKLLESVKEPGPAVDDPETGGAVEDVKSNVNVLVLLPMI